MGFCIFFNKSLEQKTALIVHSFLDSGQQGIFVDWCATVQFYLSKESVHFTYERQLLVCFFYENMWWDFFFSFYASLLPLKIMDHSYNSFHPMLLSKLHSADHISNHYTLLHSMDAFRCHTWRGLQVGCPRYLAILWISLWRSFSEMQSHLQPVCL